MIENPMVVGRYWSTGTGKKSFSSGPKKNGSKKPAKEF